MILGIMDSLGIHKTLFRRKRWSHRGVKISIYIECREDLPFQGKWVNFRPCQVAIITENIDMVLSTISRQIIRQILHHVA